MSAETLLNVMVAVVAVNSIASARFTITDRRLKFEEHGAKFGAFSVIAALASMSLWVTLAFVTGYWQFAAIVSIPLLIAVGGVATRSDKP